MKKQAIYFTIIVLISTIFVSCSQKTIKTDEKSLSQKYFLTKDTTKGALTVEVDVEIPSAFADSSVLKSIRSVVITNLFGDQFIGMNNDSILKNYVAMLHHDYIEYNKPLLNEKDNNSSYSFNNEHHLDGFSLLSDKQLFVYGIERTVYLGGAHDLNNRLYFNFDLKTGKKLTESDLFKAGYQTKLEKLLKDQLLTDCKENQEPNSRAVVSLDDTDYITDSIKPNGNFYITDESIKYVFNPYQIGLFNVDVTEIELSFDDLKPLLKPESIINYLVEKYEKNKK